MPEYRFDSAYGELYEYDNCRKAYLHVSTTSMKTEAEAIKEYEEGVQAAWERHEPSF